MPRPERVLIDTSAFYALVSATDTFHVEARQAYEALIDHEQEMWTTSYVLVETTALVHGRLGFAPLSALMRTLQPVVHVSWIGADVHTQAWTDYAASQGAGLSFVDRTTLLVTQSLNAHVFTFDRGFVQQGIPVLPRRPV